MQPRLKQRKTKIVSGWLTRDDSETGEVTLWHPSMPIDDLDLISGMWEPDWAECNFQGKHDLCSWTSAGFKSLYTGIPRKGRAVHVEIEIVVD